MIEPDEAYWGDIVKERPLDKLLKICVADYEEKESDFYIMTARSLNTLVKKVADETCSAAQYGSQKIEKVIKVPVMNVNTVIEKHFKTWPNVVSIDTEGMDHRIVKAIDWKRFPIEIACVEVNENRDGIISTMAENGYKILCDNKLNVIFGMTI